MIDKDQPKIFGDAVVAGVSSVSDGNTKYFDKGLKQLKVDENRASFLKKLDIRPEQTVLVQTTYDGSNYTRYRVVGDDNRGQGLVSPIGFSSDSLITNTKNVALFLPIADCIGAVAHDPINRALMVMHLGRQATEQHGAAKSVEFMAEQFNVDPKNLLVWLGPAPSKETYPLFSFENRSLHDVSLEHLRNAGVKTENVTICSVDTITDTHYFSHSEFLKGRRETDGRYAVAAMMC